MVVADFKRRFDDLRPKTQGWESSRMREFHATLDQVPAEQARIT